MDPSVDPPRKHSRDMAKYMSTYRRVEEPLHQKKLRESNRRYQSHWYKNNYEAKFIRREFNYISSELSAMTGYPCSVRWWWRVVIPRKACQQFNNLALLLPTLPYAEQIARDLQAYLNLSQRVRIDRDFAIVLDVSLGRKLMKECLPGLNGELQAMVEAVLKDEIQPVFAGNIIFYRTNTALLQAYRNLLQNREWILHQIELDVNRVLGYKREE